MKNLDYYIDYAKDIITKTKNRRLLKDDYAISFIASYIMQADKKWKPNMGRKRSSYLILYARYGILNYINFQSIKSNSIDKENIPEIVDKEESTIQNVINNEIFEYIKTLKPKQKLFIEEYYMNNKTLDAIGKEYGITYEAVRLQIKNGLNKIRKKFNVNT